MKVKYVVVTCVLALLLPVSLPCLAPNLFQAIADNGAVARITAEQLHEEYDANEVAADLKYKGKVLEVSGEVLSIGRSALDEKPLVTLKAGFLQSVFCYFDKAHESQLAQLVKGQHIIVRGLCVGVGFVDPELEDCALVQVQTSPPPPTSPKTEEDEGCFIATAAYGTSAAQEIDILREFRDRVLLNSPVGTKLVHFYYRTSPPIAETISEHNVLRTLVKELLVDPVVIVLEHSERLWSER